MVAFPRFGYEPGCSVLYSLEFGKMVGNAVQQAVPVVKARRNVRINHNLCCFPIEKVSDFPNTMNIWKYATRQMCCTWLLMLRLFSKRTPMFLATVHTGTTVSQSVMCGIESLVFI